MNKVLQKATILAVLTGAVCSSVVFGMENDAEKKRDVQSYLPPNVEEFKENERKEICKLFQKGKRDNLVGLLWQSTLEWSPIKAAMLIDQVSEAFHAFKKQEEPKRFEKIPDNIIEEYTEKVCSFMPENARPIYRSLYKNENEEACHCIGCRGAIRSVPRAIEEAFFCYDGTYEGSVGQRELCRHFHDVDVRLNLDSDFNKALVHLGLAVYPPKKSPQKLRNRTRKDIRKKLRKVDEETHKNMPRGRFIVKEPHRVIEGVRSKAEEMRSNPDGLSVTEKKICKVCTDEMLKPHFFKLLKSEATSLRHSSEEEERVEFCLDINRKQRNDCHEYFYYKIEEEKIKASLEEDKSSYSDRIGDLQFASQEKMGYGTKILRRALYDHTDTLKEAQEALRRSGFEE